MLGFLDIHLLRGVIEVFFWSTFLSRDSRRCLSVSNRALNHRDASIFVVSVGDLRSSGTRERVEFELENIC
jgi:hypothetical protein